MTPTASRLDGLPDPVARADFYEGVPFRRAVAWGIDVVLVFLVCLVLLPFTLFLGVFFFPLMMLVVGFLYRWRTIATRSATWGMRMMGIELREGDGGRFKGETAFLHTLGYTVSIAVFPVQLASIVMMAVSARGQGLTDSLLGTTAINRPV